ELSQTSDAVDVEFAHDALAMRLNIADTHAELVRNLFVLEALCYQCENLALAICERGSRGSRSTVFETVVDGKESHIGTEAGLPAMDSRNSTTQFLRRGILENIAATARLNYTPDILTVDVHGKNEHLNLWQFLMERLGHRQSVHDRHFNIHQND